MSTSIQEKLDLFLENDCLKRTDTKCYKADEGALPNTVIISTILLPPLGIFMRFGLQKWLEILKN